MSEFLTRLSSFFNLQKAATISVPGLIMAAAILLIYYSNPPQILRIAAPVPNSKTAPNLDIPQSCLGLAAEQSTTSGSGRLNGTDYTAVGTRRNTIDSCVSDLQSNIVAEQSTTAKLSAQIDADQKAADDLMKQYRDYELKGLELAAKYRALAQQRLNAVNRNKLLTKQADVRVQVYTDLVSRYSQERKALTDRVHAGEDQEPFADFVSRLSDKLIYVMLLGIVLGLIMDPINKIVQSALYTDGRIQRLNQSHANWRAVPTREWQNTTVRAAREKGMDPEEALRMKFSNPNYAIGTGLISQADMDAMLDRYGLSSQFGFGLILPMVVLIVASGLFVQHRILDPAKAAHGSQAAAQTAQPAGGRRG